MLAAALAEHPATDPRVLAVLARHGNPYAAATARIRLRWDNPWDGINITGLTPDASVALLNHPDLTEQARNELLTTAHTNTWGYYCQNPLADPDNLIVIAHNATSRGDSAAGVVLAANPATPDTLARQLLIQTLRDGRILPASAVTIADNLGISPAELMPHCSGETAALMNDYRHAGNLPTLLEQAPLAGEYDEISWECFAGLCTNAAYLETATHRALDGLARRDQNKPAEQLLRAILGNPFLPASTYATLLPRVYEHAHTLSAAGIAAAHTAACLHPHATVDILDLAVSATSRDTINPLLQHPHLTTTHLQALTNLLVPPPKHYLADLQLTQTITRIGLHPNAKRDVRDAVRTHTPPFADELGLLGDTVPKTAFGVAIATFWVGPSEIALLRAVHERPLLPAHIPTDPAMRMPEAALLARVITANINAHPQLMTDPDLAQAALVLAPNHHDTFATLIDTAAGIAHT